MKRSLLFIICILLITVVYSQDLSAVWEGTAVSKVVGRNTKFYLEEKLVISGDSIYGTSYHHEGDGYHHRYTIKGYYNRATGDIEWTEDMLVLEKSPKFFMNEKDFDRRTYKGKVYISADSTITIEADVIYQKDTSKVMSVVFQKNNNPSIFSDEWDDVIERNSTTGVSKEKINAVASVARQYTPKDYVEGMKQQAKEQKEAKDLLAKQKAKEKEDARLARIEQDKIEEAKKEAEKQASAIAKQEADRREKEIRDSVNTAKALAKEQADREEKYRNDSIRIARSLAKELADKEEQERKEQNKARKDSIRTAIAIAKEKAAKEELAIKEAKQKEEAARKEAIRIAKQEEEEKRKAADAIAKEEARKEAERNKLEAEKKKAAQVDLATVLIKQKFEERKKTLVTEVPMQGDSIEIRLFDNGVVDGDSISLFLNNELLVKNIGLTARAYVVKLAVNSLPDNAELTMVAENMGSIPPNTALMIAVSGDQRYQARLESTEQSSAMIRLLKRKK